MTIDQIKKVHSARPFQPFRIHLADGRNFAVEHPEFLAQSQGGRVLYVATPDDTFEIVDLLLVTSLELLNGSSTKRKRR
jgi:hypothetical protein